MHGFSVRGPGAELAVWLERAHVLCDIAGIEEREDGLHVWLREESTPLPTSAGLGIEPIAGEDAATRDWRANDRAIYIADDLIVRPPWVAPSGTHGAMELVVPRGMAFGSGEHESTALALLLMRDVLPLGGSFADVGTGSGILALFARALGCDPILACDIEPEAVAATRELVPSARVTLGGPESLHHRDTVDHVVANMTGAEILGCLPGLLRLWNGRGALVLSGIRHAEQADVTAALPAAPGRERRGTEFVALALV